MADVFRIIDKLNIKQRETLYEINRSAGADLCPGDILFDLQGNQFRIKGFEFVDRRIDSLNDACLDTLPVWILFEPISGVPIHGDMLFRSPADINFLFYNHPLYPKRVDEDYEVEYQAAGLNHACALFSFEDLEDGKLSLYGEEISGITIYRGWMMQPELYRTFYALLAEKGIFLINSPEEYEWYHLLPCWYNDFKEETPKSVWVSGSDMEDIRHAARSLDGSYIVKDYVKSRKHEWYDACFIGNIRDDAVFEKVVGNFISRQGSDLVGGVVLRKYEKLKPAGFHEISGMPLSEEYRVFIYAGKVLTVCDYWNGSTDITLSDAEYRWVKSVAERVNSAFVTVDLARKEDGSLIILELGDGQVSGLQGLSADVFYRSFHKKSDRP